MRSFFKVSLASFLLLSLSSPAAFGAVVPGTKCPKVKATSVSGGKIFTCIKLGSKLYWDNGVKYKLDKSGSTPAPKQTVSEADRLVQVGCRAFPSAIIKLQNTTGATYNKVLMDADSASESIWYAGKIDNKYAPLSNAQRIIIQYVEAVGWTGNGYSGDVNTVKTAVATFNAACNSNLYLR